MTPAEMPVSGVIVWASGLMIIISLMTTIWTIFSGPSRKNTSRLDEHGKRLDAHDIRIAGIEQSQGGLPTPRDMHELEIAMEQLRGEMKTMSAMMGGQSEIMKRLEAIVSRHDTHLMEKPR